MLRQASAFVAETADAASQVNQFAWGPNLITGGVHTCPRDDELFRLTTPAQKRSARDRLELPADGAGFVFLGRMVQEKGPFEFLEAAQALQREGSPHWFAMAGSGPLEAPIRERALRAGVEFLGDLDYPSGVLSALHAADVVVVPSFTTSTTSEQGPRVVVEASLSGCLVVGSSSGAIPEMLGARGLTFPERDVHAMIETLRHARLVIESGYEEAEDNRRRIVSLYSTGAAGKQLARLWNEVVQVKAGADNERYDGDRATTFDFDPRSVTR